MNLFASTREKKEDEKDEDDDFMFMFEQDESSNCLDLDLQRLNEETAQLGLLVSNIEARTKEDLIRWQKVLEDSRAQGKATFLQRISHMMAPGSGSSPVESIDEKAVSAQLRRTMDDDIQLARNGHRQQRYSSWRAWFKAWINGRKREPVTTDSDSEGLLVMNSVDVETDRLLPHRAHSRVHARNFFEAERLTSSSVTLAEHRYFFGDNMAGAHDARSVYGSSHESIISESTPGLQIARGLKYGALTNEGRGAATSGAAISDDVPRFCSEIRTPLFLQSKSSKSTPSILSFRGRRRKRSLPSYAMRRYHL